MKFLAKARKAVEVLKAAAQYTLQFTEALSVKIKALDIDVQHLVNMVTKAIIDIAAVIKIVVSA